MVIIDVSFLVEIMRSAKREGGNRVCALVLSHGHTTPKFWVTGHEISESSTHLHNIFSTVVHDKMELDWVR